jgi:hypothetical protein
VISLCNDPNWAVCNGKYCIECVKGFMVKGGICSPCPTNCLTCTADSNCQSCAPGLWGYQCIYSCPNNCDEAGCDKMTGYCFKCEVSWYGPQCQEECNRCENEQCELLKCSTGCKDGYGEDIYNGVSTCLPCPSFCEKCNNASYCSQCYSGLYIYQYTVEDRTVATCLNCSSTVPKCVDCSFDQNLVSCRSCQTGYVVNQDNQCVTTVTCIHCQNGCDSGGRCLGGCQPGWTGTTCDYECSYACETCINQDACLSCKDGFYTQTCSVSCNTNCQSGNSPRCRFGDGYCSNGCNKGFWGDQCENICNNNCLDITTASELCHRNGTCYYGCKSGYMGSDCSQVSSVSTRHILSTSNTRASTAKCKSDYSKHQESNNKDVPLNII